MNNKDREAFEKWWVKNRGDLVLEPSCFITIKDREQYLWEEEAWQAACEYKQKKIDSIDCYIERDEKIKKLQAENAKLKECVKFYADLNDEVVMYDSRGVAEARQVLKELEEE